VGDGKVAHTRPTGPTIGVAVRTGAVGRPPVVRASRAAVGALVAGESCAPTTGAPVLSRPIARAVATPSHVVAGGVAAAGPAVVGSVRPRALAAVVASAVTIVAPALGPAIRVVRAPVPATLGVAVAVPARPLAVGPGAPVTSAVALGGVGASAELVVPRAAVPRRPVARTEVRACRPVCAVSPARVVRVVPTSRALPVRTAVRGLVAAGTVARAVVTAGSVAGAPAVLAPTGPVLVPGAIPTVAGAVAAAVVAGSAAVVGTAARFTVPTPPIAAFGSGASSPRAVAVPAVVGAVTGAVVAPAEVLTVRVAPAVAGGAAIRPVALRTRPAVGPVSARTSFAPVVVVTAPATFTTVVARSPVITSAGFVAGAPAPLVRPAGPVPAVGVVPRPVVPGAARSGRPSAVVAIAVAPAETRPGVTLGAPAIAAAPSVVVAATVAGAPLATVATGPAPAAADAAARGGPPIRRAATGGTPLVAVASSACALAGSALVAAMGVSRTVIAGTIRDTHVPSIRRARAAKRNGPDGRRTWTPRNRESPAGFPAGLSHC